MLLWTPLGCWVALPQVAKTVSIHPPMFAAPIVVTNVANKGSVHIATVLLAGVCMLCAQLLEAGRRSSLNPDKATQSAGRLGGVFAWRDAKSMNVWTSFDCIEALVWITMVVLGWEDVYDMKSVHIVWLMAIFIGVLGLVCIVKRALAVVTYTQGEEMSDWVRVTATPLLGKAMCCFLALLILHAQAIVANPYPDFSKTDSVGDDTPLDQTLAKALYVVMIAGNYSAIKCHDDATFDALFAPHVNCSEPLCGYRTWEDLCHAWRVAPLSVTTADMILDMHVMIMLICIVGLGLAGNEKLRSGTAGKLAPHIVLILLLVLCMCLQFLWILCLTLLQLPMLILGLPAANPHAMASRVNVQSLGTYFGTAACVLVPIDTLSRFVKSRSNRGRSYFISYKQNDGNDGAVQMLAHLLSSGGAKVWLDKLVEDRSEKGMVKGVQESDVFVAVISESYFASWFCCLEMFTALKEGKAVLVVWNQSKHTVQAALSWLPSDLSFLKNNELLPIQEDLQMAGTCAFRVKAAVVKPWFARALNQVGEHIFAQELDA